MAKQVQLTIPEPCHERWDRMKPAEKGRFCDACRKQVIDFTRMSDGQLAAFFKKPSTGPVCGRFMADQLDRDMVIPKKRIPWLRYFFQIAIPAFLTSSKVYAQGGIVVRADTAVVPLPARPAGEVMTSPAGGPPTISGRVVDHNGEPLPYVSVYLKGTKTGTATDSSGRFRLEYTGTGNPVLLASYIGFESLEMRVRLQQPADKIVLRMNPANQEMEDIVVGVIVRREDKKKPVIPVISSLKDTLTRKWKLFPNPVAASSSLSLQCDKLKEGYYSLDMLTASGSIVFRREVWIDDKAKLIDFPVPAVSPGTYFVRMTHKKSGNSTSQQVIVQ
ncbi:MAG: carboxypeptidase-like regulatory domain-containing protein [Chitinophagaceae bacterium]